MRHCREKPPGADVFFGSYEQFEAAQQRRRVRQLQHFLPTLDGRIRAEVLREMHQDLADLGLDPIALMPQAAPPAAHPMHLMHPMHPVHPFRPPAPPAPPPHPAVNVAPLAAHVHQAHPAAHGMPPMPRPAHAGPAYPAIRAQESKGGLTIVSTTYISKKHLKHEKQTLEMGFT